VGTTECRREASGREQAWKGNRGGKMEQMGVEKEQ